MKMPPNSARYHKEQQPPVLMEVEAVMSHQNIFTENISDSDEEEMAHQRHELIPQQSFAQL
jgi:hypothetical protein